MLKDILILETDVDLVVVNESAFIKMKQVIILSLVSWRDHYIFYPAAFNALWPSDAIWRLGSGSILDKATFLAWQVITWTNVNFWLVRFFGVHFTANAQTIIMYEN